MLCFHVSRRFGGAGGLLCHSAWTFGQTGSNSGDTEAARHVLPRTRTLNRLLVCCPQAGFPTFPTQRRTAVGIRGKKIWWIEIGGQKRRVEVALCSRRHKDTRASAASSGFLVDSGRSHDRTARVWCCAWELRAGCRPSLQRCVSTGLCTSLGLGGPHSCQTVAASRDRTPFR